MIHKVVYKDIKSYSKTFDKISGLLTLASTIIPKIFVLFELISRKGSSCDIDCIYALSFLIITLFIDSSELFIERRASQLLYNLSVCSNMIILLVLCVSEILSFKIIANALFSVSNPSYG